MPITLITGLPGHGKGVFSLDTINKLQKKSQRPVYYHNVKDLALQWHQLENPKDWVNCPEGSIILLDEAWQTFPLRPNAQTPPDYVAQLATHRHKGYDIFIVTQQPSQLDSFVRKLIDKHYHVVRRYGAESANVHEFIGLNPDPQRSRKNSIKHSYSYPKEVYTWYKSAEVHTVQTKRPLRIYFLWFGLPLLLAFAIYYINGMLNPKTGAIAEGLQTDITNNGSETNQLDSTQKSQTNKNPQRNDEGRFLTYIEAHQPEIKDFAFTAPIYNEIVQPKTAPYPAACVIMRNKCKCYTQQATVLSVADATCRQIVENGFFVEWQETPKNELQTTNYGTGVSGAGNAPDDGLTIGKNTTGMLSRASPDNSPAK